MVTLTGQFLQCALYWVPHECTEAHISNFSIKTFYNFYCTLINLVEQIGVKKDLDEDKEICFDLLQNSRGNTINSRQKTTVTARKKVNTRLKKMSSLQNKEKHGRKKKKNLANSSVMQVILKPFLCELWQLAI